MIEVLNGFPPMVLAFACKGHVTTHDYESILIPSVERTFTCYKKVRLYFQIDPGFSGIDPGAMWDDFKIGMMHLFRWDRIAVVTDVEWVQYTFKACGFVIPCAARVFRLEETPTAKEWILDGVAQQDLESLQSRADRFLIAVEESDASLKAVTHVSRILRGRTDVQVRLFHVLPSIPPELLEFGGAEHPRLEQQLSANLRHNQAAWIETEKRKAHVFIDKALAILGEGGLSSHEVITTFSSPIHRPNVAQEILDVARTWACGTIVVGRHARSWVRGIRSNHVGEELIRKGQGFAILVVE